MVRFLIALIASLVLFVTLPHYQSGLASSALYLTPRLRWQKGTTTFVPDTSDSIIVLEDFSAPQHHWKEINDPVMGGRSTGSFSIQNGLAHFVGEVVNVPFLQAPGFIQARIEDSVDFPDITSCQSIQLELRSLTEYDGYRFSFGKTHAPGGKMFAYGYKVTLGSVSDTFRNITLPMSEFTDFWDDATGDPIRTCAEDARFCPDARTLRNLGTMAVWGEGKAGSVSLQLRSISATQCTGGDSSYR